MPPSPLLRQIRTLLAADTLAAVEEGLALLAAQEDPALLETFSRGLLIEKGHLREDVVIRKASEVGKRVQPRWQPLAALAILRRVGALDGVVHLNLAGSTGIPHVGPVAGLAGIKSIKLFNCSSLVDISALAALPGLERLDLTSCAALTDLSPLAGHPALRDAYLTRCRGVTDLSPLAQIPNLWRLDLSDCTGLVSLEGLADSPLLRELKLRGCSGLVDVSALRRLPSLYVVDLAGCDLQALGLQRADWCGPDIVPGLFGPA